MRIVPRYSQRKSKLEQEPIPGFNISRKSLFPVRNFVATKPISCSGIFFYLLTAVSLRDINTSAIILVKDTTTEGEENFSEQI